MACYRSPARTGRGAFADARMLEQRGCVVCQHGVVAPLFSIYVPVSFCLTFTRNVPLARSIAPLLSFWKRMATVSAAET